MMISLLHEWLMGFIPHERAVYSISLVLFFVTTLCLAWLANVIAKSVILRVVQIFVRKSKTLWDDMLLERHVFTRLSHLAPIVVISVMSDVVLPGTEYADVISLLHKGVSVYVIFVLLFVIDAFLNGLIDIYGTFNVSQSRPIKGYIQGGKILLWILSVLLVIAILLERDLGGLILGLGGLTAVILFVFKDSILGLVAGVQLSVNDIVRLGDWLEMPSRGADGDVIDISLTTVKVRNWDKTITTLPTYALISESFKNWRGMSESGGRRIKRALHLDMSSISFCSEALLKRLSQIDILRPHIERKEAEITAHNSAGGFDLSVQANGRRLTNIGLFRAYVEAYLRSNRKIHTEMTFLVRQLPSGPTGLPLEIYVFSNDQVWAHYEEIQADIFDHLFAIVPEFELRVFQSPTGTDFARCFSTK
jgi:miniconductance mechanosensitive channel